MRILLQSFQNFQALSLPCLNSNKASYQLSHSKEKTLSLQTDGRKHCQENSFFATRWCWHNPYFVTNKNLHILTEAESIYLIYSCWYMICYTLTSTWFLTLIPDLTQRSDLLLLISHLLHTDINTNLNNDTWSNIC